MVPKSVDRVLTCQILTSNLNGGVLVASLDYEPKNQPHILLLIIICDNLGQLGSVEFQCHHAAASNGRYFYVADWQMI